MSAPPDPTRETLVHTLGVLAVAASAAALFLLVRWAFTGELAALVAARDGWLQDTLRGLPLADLMRPVVEPVLRHVVFAPTFYVLLAGILLLEWWLPARPQPVLSAAFAQDFLWYLLQLGVFLSILSWFVSLQRWFYDAWLSGLTVTAVETWPAWTRLVFGVLLGDFLAWLHHWVRHKVRPFWHFHAVHHAQARLNVWTDSRYHVVEYFISETIRFVPLFMFLASDQTVVAVAAFSTWYARLYHANIRSSFGLFRYVLVTPQSHRVHHGLDAEYRDRNFGFLLSVWDHLFGTQYRRYDVYPETGIADDDFPQESDLRSVLSLRPLIRQQLYPFRALVRELFRRAPQNA